MNAVEIEEAISAWPSSRSTAARVPVTPSSRRSGTRKPTTIKRLRSGQRSNKSDVGGVLQPTTSTSRPARPRARSDHPRRAPRQPGHHQSQGQVHPRHRRPDVRGRGPDDGETIACDYTDFPTTSASSCRWRASPPSSRSARSAFDIKATGRLNRLYVELLKDNPDWGTAERRHDMNHFMARLIFCFFAEDTDIFNGEDLFTATIEQMSEPTAPTPMR
jgi:hypothetical protein